MVLITAAAVMAVLLVLLAGTKPAGAAFPGTNGKVAFHAYTLTNGDINPYDIYTVNPDGTGTRNLTKTPLYETDPNFSPSGNKIVFSRAFDNSNEEIYVMNADGTGQKRLTFEDDYDSSAHFSPDGKKIVFASYRGGDSDTGRDSDIYVMNADGSGTKLLTKTAVDELDPVWSPDGTKIAFGVSFSDTASGLYTMNADGSGRKKLVAHDPYDYAAPDFRPDGRKIVFGVDYGIYDINRDGSAKRKLYGGSPSLVSGKPDPHYSPDGKKIAFNASGNFDVPKPLRVMNADGTGVKNLYAAATNRRDASPSWGPR
jgi:Tol biopolymer transport system component